MKLSTASILNRTLGIVARSFPKYVAFAHPYVPVGSESAIDTLADIAEDQAFMVERIAGAVESGGYVPDYGEFPMDFTSKHDLRIDCLLDYAIRRQQVDIDKLADLSEQLTTAAASRTLVDETFGMATAHLELLESAKAEMENLATI